MYPIQALFTFLLVGAVSSKKGAHHKNGGKPNNGTDLCPVGDNVVCYCYDKDGFGTASVTADVCKKYYPDATFCPEDSGRPKAGACVTTTFDLNINEALQMHKQCTEFGGVFAECCNPLANPVMYNGTNYVERCCYDDGTCAPPHA